MGYKSTKKLIQLILSFYTDDGIFFSNLPYTSFIRSCLSTQKEPLHLSPFEILFMLAQGSRRPCLEAGLDASLCQLWSMCYGPLLGLHY